MLAPRTLLPDGVAEPSDGSPNGLVATPLIQAATQTNAPIRVCNITAAPIDIDGLQYTSIALRP
jgi:hypothetical protein